MPYVTTPVPNGLPDPIPPDGCHGHLMAHTIYPLWLASLIRLQRSGRKWMRWAHWGGRAFSLLRLRTTALGL